MYGDGERIGSRQSVVERATEIPLSRNGLTTPAPIFLSPATQPPP